MTLVPRDDGLFVADLRPSTPLTPDHPLAPVHEALVRGDEGVTSTDDGVLVTTAVLRAWPRERLDHVGVRWFDDALHVEAPRDISSSSYHWRILVDGSPAERQGPWLGTFAGPALLDETFESVFVTADEVTRAQTRSQRLRHVARLQGFALGRSNLVLEGRLGRRQVLVADRIRLDLEPGADGELPVPVLMDGDQPVDLAPAELDRVVRQSLLTESSTALGEDRWIVTAPGAARNALLAEAARTAPPEVRRLFVENPTAFFTDDEAFDSIGYGARVIGIGEAEPTATDRAPSERDWAGSDVGLVVPALDGGQVRVPAERVEALHETLARAVEKGEPTARFDGQMIPATPMLLRAVARVLDGERPPAAEGERTERSPTLVLLTADNEIVLDWAPAPAAGRPTGSFALPSLVVQLQRHQEVALRQLQQLWQGGHTGALLCDDMGLGKTLQALTFGAWAARRIRDARESAPNSEAERIDVPIVIVAPPGLLQGWLEELERRFDPSELPVVLWAPSDRPSGTWKRRVLPLSGFVKDGRGIGVTLQHAEIERDTLAAVRPDVLLIPYDQLRRLQFAVGRLRLGVMIADEAHQVKDPSSLRSKAIKAMNVDFTLMLTGTPIENGWRDLWTLCDIALPGRLGTLREFHDAYPTGGDVREAGRRLADTLRSVLVRRTRRDVLDQLPACTLVRTQAPMPEEQALVYEVERVRHQRHGGAALALLLRLSQVSLHPRQREDLPDAAAANAWARASARTSVLWDVLPRFREEGAAVLVFVRSLAMQETLQRALRLAFDLPHVGILNGQSSMGDRNDLVRRVENETGFRVMLVSPEVGGVGWNLQFATRAVLLERTWNPAKEAQMIARIHRLGQTKPVEVVTPIAVLEERRTFDVVLDELLTDKRSLSESVLAPSEVTDTEVERRFRELMGDGTTASEVGPG